MEKKGKNGAKTYTVADLIDPNTSFASVLEVYEGTQDGNLTQSIKHRTMVTTGLTGGSDDSSTQNRFVLRNANLTTGDINGDGGITISDGVLLQQYILGKGSFDEYQLKCADLTGDAYVDVFDMIIIRKKLTE